MVEREGCDLMKEAFQRLLSIFVEHASEDAMELVPGHSYFLEANEQKARRRLETTLKPLLEDYLDTRLCFVVRGGGSLLFAMDRFAMSPPPRRRAARGGSEPTRL